MKPNHSLSLATGRDAPRRWIFAIGLLALAAGVSALAADLRDVPPRVSYIDGSGAYEPAGDVDWSEVTVNLPLLSGDRLLSHPDSRLEVELGYDNFLRLGEDTDLTFRRVSGSELEMDLAVGELILRVNESGRFRINLPAASVRIKKEGLYRFSVSEDGYARVAVRKGVAEVSNDHRERKVKAGEELAIDHPQSSLSQVSYASLEDDFDIWSDRRDAQFVSAYSTRYVGGRYAGVYDLDRYGEWRYVSHFGTTVWFPFSSSGWRPFYVGRWGYWPGWGWTWISYEPWGWLPYHYGSWSYYRPYGWCWIPGGFSSWSPAVVDFYSGGGYVGWAPRRYFPGRGRGGGGVTIINNNNTTIVDAGGWNRTGAREGLTVVPSGEFRSRGRVDQAALAGSDRTRVAETLRPATPLDLPDRPTRGEFRSNPSPVAGVGGPRVVGVGRSGASTPGQTAAPANGLRESPGSGWSGVSRRPAPTSTQPSEAGGAVQTPRSRNPASSAPAAVPPSNRGDRSGGAVSPATTNTRPSGSWSGRGRGVDRPSAPPTAPASGNRGVAPPRSRPPASAAPPSRSSGSRSLGGSSSAGRSPSRVTPSRTPSRPSSVRPSAPPRSSVSRPSPPPRSSAGSGASRPNRERPPQ